MPGGGPTTIEPAEPWPLPKRVRITRPEADGSDEQAAAVAVDDEQDDATHD